MIAAPPVPFTPTPLAPFHAAAMIALDVAFSMSPDDLLDRITSHVAAETGDRRQRLQAIREDIELLELEALTRPQRVDLDIAIGRLRGAVDPIDRSAVTASVGRLRALFDVGRDRDRSSHEDVATSALLRLLTESALAMSSLSAPERVDALGGALALVDRIQADGDQIPQHAFITWTLDRVRDHLFAITHGDNPLWHVARVIEAVAPVYPLFGGR